MKVKMPDGSIIEAPEGATKADVMRLWKSGGTTDYESLPVRDSIGRQLGLGARNVIEGAAGLPMMLGDAANSALNLLPGVNLGMPSQALSGGLTAAGFPQPQTEAERLYAGMQRGGAGAVAGMGAGGLLASPSMMANPALQAASGMAAGGGSEIAQEAGAGPMGQMAAGLGAGMLPYAPMAGAQSALNIGRELYRPLSAAGRDRIAGRVMNDLAVNPEAAILRAGEKGKFIGKPTLGQASGDIGLLGAEKRIRTMNEIPWAVRERDQTMARNTLMDKLVGTEDVVKRIETLRDSATSKLREAAYAEQTAPVNTAVVDDLAKSMLEGPERKRSLVYSAVNDIRKKLKDGEEYVTDIKTLYGVRKEINDKLAGKSDRPTDQFAKSQLIELKGALDAEISKVAPSWGSYLSEYARYSTKIDRLNAMQKMQRDTTNAVQMRGADGDEMVPVMSRQKWFSQVEKKVKDLRPQLTSGQERNLERITQDMRRTASPPELRLPGSDTFANMSAANVLGNMFTNKKWANNPAVKTALRPLSYLYRMPDQAIVERISEAMLDPDLGAKLMQSATDENLQSIAQLLGRKLSSATLGTSYGLLGNGR